MDETISLTIGYLYPDLLNLYGDRGNIIALERRCKWRGIQAKVVSLGAGQDADFESIDLFFIGGGQDFDQYTLLDDLGIGTAGSKASRLKAAIEADVPVLAICGGYQILGEYYLGHEGQRADFIGAIPMFTEAGNDRLIGNLVFNAEGIEGSPVVVGFENHAGRTFLREGARPLGRVVEGFGNNGQDGTEGLRYRNVIATYSHGPLLPKNPKVADSLIGLALQRRHPEMELSPLDDLLELNAHDTMVQRLTT
jgi:CobQ-like glutamine amidotransferase family enzyme